MGRGVVCIGPLSLIGSLGRTKIHALIYSYVQQNVDAPWSMNHRKVGW